MKTLSSTGDLQGLKKFRSALVLVKWSWHMHGEHGSASLYRGPGGRAPSDRPGGRAQWGVS